MDLIEVKISDITLTNVGFAVFLKPREATDSRVVPIFIGPLETHAITSVLDGITPPRPMTHDLMMLILPNLGGQIIKVTIDDIVDNTFYAKLSLRRDEEIFMIDARPSDSIALALRAGAPIYITRKILEEAGVMMNEEDISSESEFQEEEPVSQPRTQLQVLEDELQKAVQKEDYEIAARLRDQIKKIVESS
ncbi:MAG: bifunctional nuclease family protein [Leptospiraceae bacterium]|nr:bifunctional nuclease family protein [Leptospiraceae bacterium]